MKTSATRAFFFCLIATLLISINPLSLSEEMWPRKPITFGDANYVVREGLSLSDGGILLTGIIRAEDRREDGDGQISSGSNGQAQWFAASYEEDGTVRRSELFAGYEYLEIMGVFPDGQVRLVGKKQGASGSITFTIDEVGNIDEDESNDIAKLYDANAIYPFAKGVLCFNASIISAHTRFTWLNACGQVQWQRSYPELAKCADLQTVETSDGLLLFGRYQPQEDEIYGFIYKIAENGALQWHYIQNVDRSIFCDLAATDREDIIAVSYPITGGIITRLSKNGNAIWKGSFSRIPGEQVESINHAIDLSRLDQIAPLNGGYVVSGRFRIRKHEMMQRILLYFNKDNVLVGYLPILENTEVDGLYGFTWQPDGILYAYGNTRNLDGMESAFYFLKLTPDIFTPIAEYVAEYGEERESYIAF